MTVPTFASSGNLLADRRYAFGRDLAGRGDLAAAADLFAQAAEAEPAFAAAWFAVGETAAKLGDRAGAVAAFEKVLALDPEDRCGAALHLARLGAADPARAMSRAYVQTLFEQYAPRFDRALEALAYRGPQLLFDGVMQARRGATFPAALDLGCGTGLAGAAFRPCAAHLTGVDLSPGMIACCRAKGLYDRLEAEELAAFLEAERRAQRRYDLVVAADVFAYLYDLVPVVQAVADVLRGGGIVAFTVETQGIDGPDESITLGEKLRYRHGSGHVRAAVGAAGLALIALAPATTRIEAGEAVSGLVAVATRHGDRV
ncbi:MAG: methyltransferase domain-containing protein [Xanthobacteraceae bacterium]|nr:methyltransferase domain-containing protein [Xanthobacteraceae bacterium]